MNTKKLIILFILSLIFSNCELNAQARIGYTKKTITEEFSHLEQEEGYTDSGTTFLDVYFSHGSCIYYFNEEGISEFCILIPKNDQLLHKIIKKNNENYVEVSDTEWKMYTQSAIMTVVLLFLESGTPFFLYEVE